MLACKSKHSLAKFTNQTNSFSNYHKNGASRIYTINHCIRYCDLRMYNYVVVIVSAYCDVSVKGVRANLGIFRYADYNRTTSRH